MIGMIIVKLNCGEPHGRRSVTNIFQKINMSTINLTRDKGLIWNPQFNEDITAKKLEVGGKIADRYEINIEVC